MTNEELSAYIFSDLGFCRCGQPKEAIELLREVLHAIRDRSEASELTDRQLHMIRLRDLLGAKGTAHEIVPVYYTYLYFLHNKGLIKHEKLIDGSSLTEKGAEILEALNECEIEGLLDGEPEHDELPIKLHSLP